MLTDNFTLFALSAMSNSTATTLAVEYIDNYQNKTWNTNIKTTFPLTFAAMSQNKGGCWIMLGSDNKEASKTDYALKSPIDESNFSYSNAVVSTASALGDKKIYSVTVTYTGNGSITIGEIGLRANVMNTNGSFIKFLCARQALDSPITVNNGDTFSVSMAIG